MTPTAITRQQSREVDRRAIERLGMNSLVLMENAGRGTTDVLCRLIDGDCPDFRSGDCPDFRSAKMGLSPSNPSRAPIVICCGKGNNAGDGLVIARHLDLRGHVVRVLVWAEPTELTGDAGANLAILQKAGMPIEFFGSRHDSARLARHLDGASWIVDGLLGTGTRGEPRPPLDAVIEQLNAASAPRLAVDVPSGLDCDTGQAARSTIRAADTCTFVAMKRGFLVPGAEQYTGRVHVLDIGVPRRVLDEVLAEE